MSGTGECLQVNKGLTEYANHGISSRVDILGIYKCLCNRQRLRILNLLHEGPLCVCHLMEILQADQVSVSKQLQFMKRLGMVTAERRAQWMVYRLADPSNRLLEENLKCLQDCRGEKEQFQKDLQKRRRLLKTLSSSALKAGLS